MSWGERCYQDANSALQQLPLNPGLNTLYPKSYPH